MFEKTTALISAYIDLKDQLISSGFQITGYKEIDYGVQFNVSKSDIIGMVRIYFSKKKGITYDISQIKDENLQRQINNYIINETEINDNLGKPINQTDELFIPVIGTDESGKGDYFGPLVAAGVFVNKSTKPLLEKIGVKDSKKISDEKILDLSQSIKKICVNQYAIIEISPERYNNLYNNFKNENKNLNTLLAWAHAKAIEEVLGKVDCDNALSDKFADEKFIVSKLQEKGKKIILRQQHKAESNIAVAAASILARARFLEKLKKLSQEHNIDLAKGASELVVEQAKGILNLKGKETLGKVAKLHFKTTQLVIKEF